MSDIDKAIEYTRLRDALDPEKAVEGMEAMKSLIRIAYRDGANDAAVKLEADRRQEKALEEEQTTSVDFNPVSRPRHYAAGRIEAKDALASMFAMADPEYLTPMAYYWWGCAFKYLWRWTNKGGPDDLCKAKQCIDFLVEEYYGND